MYTTLKGKGKTVNGIDVEFQVSIDDNEIGYTDGSYEIWDKQTNGLDYYEEGSLTFLDGELVDYDGCYCLDENVIALISTVRKIGI
jgi:hypothetical protein